MVGLKKGKIMMTLGDIRRLKQILKYCDDINEIHIKFGETYHNFVKEKEYRKSISMCLMRIGELVNGLDNEIIYGENDIPWQDFIKNRFAHRYGKVDMETTWQTSVEDIPNLQKFCIEYERK
jgi:uncharacterized protein with HEPN domain